MVALLLAMSVAGVYLHRLWLAKQEAKKAPPAVPSTVEQQSSVFSYSKVQGQQTIYTVRASRATEFKEGSRNLLEDVSITVYGKRGERKDTLETKACDFISTTGKISCAGEVKINLQASGVTRADAKAIQVVTSSVAFDRDSGKARTDKPVTFRWPAGEGQATGVEYDSNDGMLRLERSVAMSLAPSSAAIPASTAAPAGPSPEKPLNLAGDSMLFRRDARTVQVLGTVHAQQTSNDLTAESLVLELDNNSVMRACLIASGHPQLRDTGSQGPIALDADEISANVTPEGWVKSVVASGSVHATRNMPGGDDVIQAGHMQMDLATRQNAPRLLTASGGVTLTSSAAAPSGGTRRVESEALEVRFASDIAGNITKRPGVGSRPGQTLLESVNTLAPAQVDWENVAVANGKPTKQSMRMRGRKMNLKFDGQNQLQQLVSFGNVEVTRQIGDAPQQTTTSRDLTAKFTGSGEWSTIDQTGDVRFREGPRSGQGDRAHMDRATNSVTLTGSVILADLMTRTVAESAVFTQGSNELRADGHVLTTELRAGTGGLMNFAPEAAHITAEHLVADPARGHAAYSGNGRIWQGPSVVEADTIELDNPSQVLIARGHVRGVFPQTAWTPAGQAAVRPSRSGTDLGHVRGNLLTYWQTESRARLDQDASVEWPNSSIHANQIDLYFSSPGGPSLARQLTRAEAAGEVEVRQQDRRGTSNRAQYTASEGKFVLSEGKPTVYDSNGDTITGRQLTFFFADDRIVVDSAEGTKTVTLHQVEK